MDKTKKVCYNIYVIRNKKLITKWSRRQVAKSLAFHASIVGSNPAGITNIGEWRNWLAHTTDNRETLGSSPRIPTIIK